MHKYFLSHAEAQRRREENPKYGRLQEVYGNTSPAARDRKIAVDFSTQPFLDYGLWTIDSLN